MLAKRARMAKARFLLFPANKLKNQETVKTKDCEKYVFFSDKRRCVQASGCESEQPKKELNMKCFCAQYFSQIFL